MRKHLLGLTFILSGRVSADVMNLNEFTPTHIEDASTVEPNKLFLQLAGRIEKIETDEITYRPILRYGATDRLQIEAGVEANTGGDEVRSGESVTAIQYELNNPKDPAPMFGISPFIAWPTGKFSEGIDPGAKFLMTSTLKGKHDNPEAEIHANVQIRHNSSRQAGERSDEISYGIGYSRRLKDKLALVLDVIHLDDEEKNSSRQYAEAGFHQELTKYIYLSYGFSKDFSADPTDWAGLLGLEIEL
jgi:hypothetical protein